MQVPDAILVGAVLGGGREAYDELVRRHAASVAALCFSRVGPRGPIDDMVQEAFLRGFQGLASLAEPEKFGAWVRGIALRACLDWLKSKQRRQLPLETTGEPASQDRAPLEERSRAVLDAVAALDEPLREVITMFYFGKKSYKEMSAALGITAAAVNARLTKARAELRARLATVIP